MTNAINGITKFLLALLIGTFATVVSASAGEVYVKWSWGEAVDGYDVVAYHTQDAAIEGSAEFSTQYLGETWLFSSQENLDLFTQDPDRYRPAYGGHCAWAMSKGKKASGNPKVFKVVNGTLYLNVSRGVQNKWFKDIPGFIEKADAEWPSVRAKLNS